jgi:gliding motility-associated-like protein
LSNSSFAWTVTGNGTLATGQGTGSIIADFTTQGTATIKVIETSAHNCASEEAELQVHINDCSVIIAGYAVDQQEICTGESVVFTNTTTGATSAATYEWNFGTGATPATATGEGPHTVTYDGLAPATIQLTVTEGAKSDQFIAGYQVVVHGGPALTNLGDLDVCEGSNLNLAGHITPEGGTYSGTHVNGTTYDAIQNGDELVTYDYLDAFGCDATATFTVTTHSLQLVSAAPMEVCELDGMTILSTGAPIGGTYTGTGVTAGSFDPASGNQTLTYTYTDGNSCSAATTFDISVLNSIDPFVSIEALEASYCEGTAITAAIDNATISGNISGTTYSWFINGDQDGWVSAQTYTSSTLSDGDEIKVLMTLPASNCVTAQFYESAAVLVQIEQTIIPEITALDTILCANASETLTLEVSDLNGGQNTWEWTKDGTVVGTQSSLLVGAAGLYEVMGTGGNCGSETATQEVVMINPEVRILTNGSDVASLNVAEEAGVELEAQSTGNVTFEWEGNGVLMLETSPLLTVNISAPSVFVVKVSEEGCNGTDTVEINVSETFAVSPLITVNGNGINEAWDIQGLDAYESHRVMLHNKWGTQVFETTDYTNNPWSGMNPNSGVLLPSGTYYYTIELNGKEATLLTGFVTLMR